MIRRNPISAEASKKIERIVDEDGSTLDQWLDALVTILNPRPLLGSDSLATRTAGARQPIT